MKLALTTFLAWSCWAASGVEPIQVVPERTRVDVIEEARDAKTATLQPDVPGKLERRLIQIKDEKLLERIKAGVWGFGPRIGGMSSGSGFAAGTNFLSPQIGGGKLSINGSASVSMNAWTKLEAGLTGPHLTLRAARYDYNSLPYYGKGPDSEKEGRSDYRLEDTTFDAVAGLQPRKHVTLALSAGFEAARIRAGEDARFVSATSQYPRMVESFARQTSLVRSGAFIEFDNRDNANRTRRGGRYLARFDDYRARSGRPYDFRQVELDAQHHIAMFNQRRVIALRAHTVQSFTQGVNRVPFFHQVVLGGSDDLRGFRPFRFQDDNMFVMNAEYRWEVFSGLDLAAFADAGRVSGKRWDFHPRDLETSVGFGLRFNARNATILRLDVGFSHEGFQVFVKFNNVFRARRTASSSAAHIF